MKLPPNVFLYSIAVLLSSCATRMQHGDLDGFLFSRVREYGGVVPKTNATSHVIGTWTYFEDRYGIVVKSTDVSLADVDALMRSTYGVPWEKELANGERLFKIGTQLAGVTIWYKQADKGVEITINKRFEFQSPTSEKPPD